MVYIPVVILALLGAIVGGSILLISSILGPKLPNRKKDSAYECGMVPIQNARHRISVRFYLVAILFLLFDVETVFFYPWAVVFKKYLSINTFILVEMVFFFLILLVGYFYVLGKGALEWE